MKQVLIVAALVASASAFAPASRCVRSFAFIVGTFHLKFVSRVLPLVDIENNDWLHNSVIIISMWIGVLDDGI